MSSVYTYPQGFRTRSTEQPDTYILLEMLTEIGINRWYRRTRNIALDGRGKRKAFEIISVVVGHYRFLIIVSTQNMRGN